MSSEAQSHMFVHDDSLFRCSNSEIIMFPSDAELQFFTDPYSPFSDSAIDILQAISNSDHSISNRENPVDESHSLDQFSSNVLSSSPPSQQLECLSLHRNNDNNNNNNNLQQLLPATNNNNNVSSSSNDFQNLSGFHNLEVKNEECYAYNQPLQIQSLCYDDNNDGVLLAQNVDKFLQRSFSIGSFHDKTDLNGFRSRFDTLMESPNFQNQPIGCPENEFFSSQIRRVFSTGDLQNSAMARSSQRSFSSENSIMEDANFKVGRYSAEERKERISKYRAKRTQRNFNKTIKYACRKTLADNRPRIRGRFARNDEPGEIPKVACSTREEDDDDIWMERLHGGDGGDERMKQLGNVYGQMQFQYCGF